jgi:hypothetical protein
VKIGLRIGIALGLENTAAVIRFGCLPNHTCFVRKPEMPADPLLRVLPALVKPFEQI